MGLCAHGLDRSIVDCKQCEARRPAICTIQTMGKVKVWKRLPGTYEGGTQMKVTPEDHRDATYILVGGPDAENTARMIVDLLNRAAKAQDHA